MPTIPTKENRTNVEKATTASIGWKCFRGTIEFLIVCLPLLDDDVFDLASAFTNSVLFGWRANPTGLPTTTLMKDDLNDILESLEKN
jgi:hypothetical protein